MAYHGSLGPEDVRTVMRSGVSKQAIQDAMEVAFLFNIYDRLAQQWDGMCRLWMAGTTKLQQEDCSNTGHV